MRFLTAAVRHLRHLSTLSLAWLAIAVAVACTLQNSNTNTCGQGQTSCNGTCVTTSSDPFNCNVCGNVCAPGQVCSLSQCKIGCDGGLMQCGNACVSAVSDAAHCGGCNIACQAGYSCVNSVCTCPAGAPCNNVGSGGGTGSGGVFGSGAVSSVGGTGAVVGSGGGLGSGGTGAVTGSGGAGGGSGGAGAAPSTEVGGYLVGGNWKGYVWTGVEEAGNSMINPPNFEAFLQPPYCASGNVAWQTDYSGVAIWGWTLNQGPKAMPTDPDPPIGTITPTLPGVTVNVTAPAAATAELRVQIQAPDGTFWCAPLPVKDGTNHYIPWGDFVTNCWVGGTPQTPYANEPLESIMITVPGPGESDPNMPRPFEFCVNFMQESDDSAVPPKGTSCSLAQVPGSPSYVLTADQVANPLRDGHTYVTQNNVWAGTDTAQTITGLGTSFSVTAQGNSNPTNGAPASFPSVFVGSNHGRNSGTASLPKQVSAILASAEGIPTAFRWSGSGSAFNAAYDIWFSTGSGGDPETPSATYMMVWLHSQGVQPLGTNHGNVTVDGRSWQFWYCGSACQDGVDVVSYVPANGSMNEYTFNLKPFMQHAVDNQRLQTGWYLTNVFGGFEIWSGGQGLKVDNFCTVVPP